MPRKAQNKPEPAEVASDGAAAAVAVAPAPTPAPTASPAAASQPPAAPKKGGRGKKADTSAEKAPSEKAPSEKPPSGKAAPAEKASESAAEKKAPAEKAPDEKPAEKKTPASEEKAPSEKAPAAKKPRRKNVLAVRPESVPESNAEVKPRAPRRVPTAESVKQEFEELVKEIETEITRLKASQAKSKGVKFLLTVNKKVKALSGHALRLTKEKKVVKRDNANSGFRKPVQISPELAKFIGWAPSELHSRTEVTKFFCDYIEKNNLQNPNDGRQIMVENDPKLKKLLKYDSAKDDKPLTYYSLQTYLKDHYVKSAAPAAATAAPASTPAKKA